MVYFNLNKLRGKYLLLGVMLFYFSSKSFTQTRWEGDRFLLDRIFKLKIIPDIKVWDWNPIDTRLLSFIKANQKHPGKPIILIADSYGSPATRITDIANSSIPDQYNVIVLLVGRRDDVIDQAGRYRFERIWPRLLVVKTEWGEDFKSFSSSTVPFLLFADKEMNVLFSLPERIKPVSEITRMTDYIYSGRFNPRKHWYTNSNVLTGEDDPERYYYNEFRENGGRFSMEQGTKTSVLRNFNYVRKDGSYYYDGVCTIKNQQAQQLLLGEFKEGVPIKKLMQWYDNGKIKMEMPVTGVVKTFSPEGKITLEGNMLNGLGNGLFSFYTSDSTKETYTYKNGELNGPARSYLKGKITCEKYYIPGYIPKDEECFSEGLLVVRTEESEGVKWGYINSDGKLVIPASFDEARTFNNGKAIVHREGKYFAIDKTGRRVD